MGKLSKFFCVAVAGATCDGRTIEENWITEMAESYNPATYTANVNIEHLRGISPEPPFNCQGKVVAVEKRTIDLEIGGKTEKRAALFAQVEANDNLVAYNAKGQKLHSSIEVNPSFASTGKAYLQGLAVTDSPASLGTDVMTFAASQGDKNFLNPRKLAPGNLFSAVDPALAFNLEFEVAPGDDAGGEAASFFKAAKDFFAGFGKAPEPASPPPAPAPAPAPAAEPSADFAANVAQGFTKLTEAMEAMSRDNTARFARLTTDHNALKASIESTDANAPKRPPATGGGNFTATDC